MASANPFADRSQHDLNENPFANNTSNPFNHPNDSTFSINSQDTAKGQPAQTTTAAAGGASGGWGFGFGQREVPPVAPAVDIDSREAALRAREEDVRRREEALGMKENNWPPFFPFLHHKIESLPDDHQPAVKLLYTQWLALVVTLIFNLLGCIFLLIAGASEGGADTGASIGYLPIIGALSFILWYRPIYLGFSRTEGKAMAFFFYVYFIFAGFHVAFSAYMAVGIPSTGSAGLINTISSFSQGHILAAVFGVITSVGWILQAAGGALLYKRVWDYKNNNADITFQQATTQFKNNSIKTVLLHQARIG